MKKIVLFLAYVAVGHSLFGQDMYSFMLPRHGKQRSLYELQYPGNESRVTEHCRISRMTQNLRTVLLAKGNGIDKSDGHIEFTLTSADGAPVTCNATINTEGVREVFYKRSFIDHPFLSGLQDMDAIASDGSLTKFSRMQYGPEKTGDGMEGFLAFRIQDYQLCDNCYKVDPKYIVDLMSTYCANTGRVVDFPVKGQYIQKQAQDDQANDYYHHQDWSNYSNCAHKGKSWFGRNWGYFAAGAVFVGAGVVAINELNKQNKSSQAPPPPPPISYGGQPYTPVLVAKIPQPVIVLTVNIMF